MLTLYDPETEKIVERIALDSSIELVKSFKGGNIVAVTEKNVWLWTSNSKPHILFERTNSLKNYQIFDIQITKSGWCAVSGITSKVHDTKLTSEW